MRVIQLIAENFKVLQAIEIAPGEGVNEIAGKNGQGKSSVLDAIWVALAGRGVAPPKPIRDGEEECRIVLALGETDAAEYLITRKFTLKEDGKITDSVKVESGDGKQRFNSPQAMIDELMGQIGFDPVAFATMKPEDQADMLLQMVPLPIDLETMAREDAADYSNRTDVNREITALTGQIAGIPERTDLPETAPDRQALADALATAAETNSAISQEEDARAREDRQVGELDAEIERLKARLEEVEANRESLGKHIAAREPLRQRVDVETIRGQLRDADAVSVAIAQREHRKKLVAERDEKQAKSEGYTAAMEARERARKEALAGAKMPIEGLAFGVSEKGKAIVLFNGVPFEQASTSDKIRASTAIAMKANPELRVLCIRDGSLLDEDNRALIAEMAAAEDFQILMEVVGAGSGKMGFVIEGGTVKGGKVPEPEPKKKAAKKADAEPAAEPAKEAGKDGQLL